MKDYKIQLAVKNDIVQINDIVNHYIKTSGANWSWHSRSLEDAQKWFDQHDEKTYPIYVAKAPSGEVLGYASLSAFRGKDGYWPVAENSIYLGSNCKGYGIGRKLMETLISHARSSKLEVITAWIDSENISSIEFHKKMEVRGCR